MERESEILMLLAALREEYPAVQVEAEHVHLESEMAIFRAVITLPNGGKATGYGSASGQADGDDGTVLARAEIDAIGRALQLLGFDSEHLAEMDAARDDVSLAASDSGLHPTAVDDEYTPDPFNLGEAPSPADVAAATGMQLGVRREAPQREGRPAPSPAPQERVSSEARGAAPVERPMPVDLPPETAPEPTPTPAPTPAPPPRPEPRSVRAPQRSAARATAAADTDDSDADVVHSSFWQWAARRGLNSQEEIEELLGQSIRGLVPAVVRRMIVEAQEGGDS